MLTHSKTQKTSNKRASIRNIAFPILVGMFCAINATAQNLIWSEKCSPNQKEAYTVAFSNDGKRIFSGSEHLPTSVRIFDADNGRVLWDDTLATGLMCAQDITFNGNNSRIVLLEEYGNILLYDNTGTKPVLLKSFKTPTTAAFAVALSPDGSKMAVSCSDKKLITYNINDASVLRNVDAHLNYVYGVDWSVNNDIATCGDDKLIKLWDTTGTLIRTFSGHTQSVRCVRFTPDGTKIVSCSRDNSIKIWDVSSGNLLKTLNGHTKVVRQVDISDDGTKLVSCDEDGVIKTWDIASGNLERNFSSSATKGIVYSVKFKPGSKRYIAVANTQGYVQYWDLLFPTSITGQAKQDLSFSIYPCPSRDVLTINTDKAVIQKIAVMDISGHCIFVKEGGQTGSLTISTSSLLEGIYILSIQTSEGIHTKQIIKE